MFESKIISIAQYIKKRKSENSVLDFVYRTRTARNYATKPATTRSVSYRI